MTKKSDPNNLHLKLGKLYFVRESVFGSSGELFLKSLLAKSLLEFFKEEPAFEAKNWKPLEVERFISLDTQIPVPDLDYPVFDIEASISALSKKGTLKEKLGVPALVNAVYQADARKYCAVDRTELEEFNLTNQLEDLFNAKPAILAVGYAVSSNKETEVSTETTKRPSKKNKQDNKDNLSHRLLWEFREARSYGIRRFLFDDKFIQIPNEEDLTTSSLELDLSSVTQIEREHLSGVKKLTVILRAIAVSDLSLEEIELEIKNVYADSIFKSRDEKVLVSLEKKAKSYQLKSKIPLEGSYVCKHCKTIFPRIIDSAIPKGIVELFAGISEAEMELLKPEELFEILMKSSYKNIVSDYSKLILKSNFKTKLEQQFVDLSYFEQIHFFILFLAITKVENVFFIFNSIQDPYETAEGQEILELLYVLVKNDISILILTNAAVNSKLEILEIGEIEKTDSQSLVQSQSKTDSKLFDLKSFKSALEKSPSINIGGKIGSGKSRLLHDITTNAPDFKNLKQVETREYFAIENGQIKYRSKKAKNNFKLFRNPFSSVAELLNLNEFVIELYSSTLKSKRLGLFKENYIGEPSAFGQCLECDGRGFVTQRLELGYQGMKVCSECYSTGLPQEFKEVSFLDVNYLALNALTLGEVTTLYNGEKRFRLAADFAEKLKQIGIDLLALRFNQRLFELTNQEKIGLILLSTILEEVKNVAYLIEHPFDFKINTRFEGDKSQLKELLNSFISVLARSNSKFVFTSYGNPMMIEYSFKLS